MGMAGPSADRRVVRVFISSTFRDMGAERDELVKRTFPALRKLCESRGVTWGEVDLRWGITDEQKAEGKVLPVCLDEIRGCRPYFIGLLGERYGSLPDALDSALVRREPWLARHAGRSVTELEILHGVLNDPDMAEYSFFYLRDPAYVEGKPPTQYREVPTVEEIEEHGPEEAERQAADRRAKLADLKARIRSSGLPVRDDYPDPRALGELVLADLSDVIERLYPRGSEPDPLAREAGEHEAFAAKLAGVYIGRQAYFHRLDAHAAGNGPPLVVLGASGLGKSALLANWALRYRAAHPERLVLMHFIGASPASTDWAAMVRRIIGELSRRFGFAIEIPDKPDALRMAFASAVHMASTRGRVVLVLDALNQLEDREAALDLAWLPPLPASVRVVLSTLPGRPLAATRERNWPTLLVDPLQQAECDRLIVDYLATYAKALDAGLRERIAASAQCANPLYLRALLDELRLWGEYKLDKPVDYYLAAPSVDSLYELILKRYEADYERDRPGLVRDTFTMLWAARRGLSEAELLDLLGTDGQPLPRAYWSQLFLAAEPSLTSRSGLLGFFHEYLRTAVERRYLQDAVSAHTAHVGLADYFTARELGPRTIDELPWQLSRASAWQRLANLVCNLEFLEPAWDADAFEIRTAWTQIEANSSIRMVDAYRSIADSPPKERARAVGIVAELLRVSGHPEYALALYRKHERIYRELGNQDGVQVSLGNQAIILQARGDMTGAMALLKEQERFCRELGNPAGLQVSLGNQAVILQARGDLDGAMALLKEAEQICRDIGERGALPAWLGNQANILRTRGDLDAAMALHREAERICRELDNPDSLQHSLGSQANILRTRGDLDRAMALHKEQERICRELGNPDGLHHSLSDQAEILQVRGDLDAAMALNKEAEWICRQLGNQNGLQKSIGNQAFILRTRGDLDGAMDLYRQQEQICRELGNPDSLQHSLNDLGFVLQARGDLDGAMALFKEVERINRDLGHQDGLQSSLNNQAFILRIRGDLKGAMALHKEQERICRGLGNQDGLQVSLGNQALILQTSGDLKGAMTLHKEEERICRELGNQDSLQRSLNNQAVILKARGDLNGAMDRYKEAERICRDLGNQAGLQASMSNQALILQDHGNLDGAIALLKEAERICREIVNPEGLQFSLGFQASIFDARGDHEGAMSRLKEQERICREIGNPTGLALSLGNQAFVLGHSMGQRREALLLAEEAYRLVSQAGPASLTQQVRQILQSLR